jgi:small subunit ribosomal protein S20
MPNTSSARKALRVGLRRTDENRRTKQTIRQAIKTVTAETLSELFSVLDKAAKKDVIHPNKAARLKSRFTKKMTVESKPVEEKAKVKKEAKTAKKTTKTSKKTK